MRVSLVHQHGDGTFIEQQLPDEPDPEPLYAMPDQVLVQDFGRWVAAQDFVFGFAAGGAGQ